MSWRVSNGEKVWIAIDAILGFPDLPCLTDLTITDLQQRDFFMLNHVADAGSTSLWQKSWMSAAELGLVADQNPSGMFI
jgi:hypothetical protein